jgi:hypothetical protein
VQVVKIYSLSPHFFPQPLANLQIVLLDLVNSVNSSQVLTSSSIPVPFAGNCAIPDKNWQ